MKMIFINTAIIQILRAEIWFLLVVLVRSALNFCDIMCIFQSKNSTYVKATQHQLYNSRSTVLNFDSTEFLFPNNKVSWILRKSVQTLVICRCSQTNTAVSWHFNARIPLEALLCRLPKSFVFNRCHLRNYLSTNDLVNQ